VPEVIERVKDNLEVKEQKRPQLIKPKIQKLIIIIMRISIKTAKILTFTDLDVKAVKELKMLQ